MEIQELPQAAVGDQDKRELRDDILQAALKLFIKKGFFHTSVTDIRREADVSTGAIYHYFKNKEAIAEALYSDLIERLNASIDEICRRNESGIERLRTLVELFFGLTEQAPEAMQFLFFFRHQEFLPQEKAVSLSEPLAKLREILQQGMKAGEIRRMNPAVAFACFYGVITGAVRMRLDGLLEKPIDHYFGEVWDAAWRSISAPY